MGDIYIPPQFDAGKGDSNDGEMKIDLETADGRELLKACVALMHQQSFYAKIQAQALSTIAGGLVEFFPRMDLNSHETANAMKTIAQYLVDMGLVVVNPEEALGGAAPTTESPAEPEAQS